MRKLCFICTLALLLSALCGCVDTHCQVVATTAPIYEFTAALCEGTDIEVCQLITEDVSCLHDYTLQVSQMRMLEKAELLIENGAGLELFLEDLSPACPVVDCSSGMELLGCPEEEHHDDHHHETDAHYWLSPDYAGQMVQNICRGLSETYPQYADLFTQNQAQLLDALGQLKAYGETELSTLKSRDLITFHNGFSYFAEAFSLNILRSLEEESGSEASAAELKELITLIRDNDLPAIFTETNGATAAAEILSAETGAAIFCLDMGMSDLGYFEAMYHNIRTVKEALG